MSNGRRKRREKRKRSEKSGRAAVDFIEEDIRRGKRRWKAMEKLEHDAQAERDRA